MKRCIFAVVYVVVVFSFVEYAKASTHTLEISFKGKVVQKVPVSSKDECEAKAKSVTGNGWTGVCK